MFKRVENDLNVLQAPAAESKDMLSNYIKFVDTLDDAQLVIKKDKAEESKKSEQSG